ITGWVNGNLYLPANEVLGILPILPDVRIKSGMSEYIPSLELELCKRQHAFLARKQGIQKPALPVHTPLERDKFRTLMRENTTFCPKSGPINWDDAAKVWNSLADREKNLTYKLGEQLMTYYHTWKMNLNIKETLSMTLDARRPVLHAIRNPLRLAHAPPVSERHTKPHEVQHGFNIQQNDKSPIPSATEGVQSSSNLTSLSIEGYIARKRVGECLQRAEPVKRTRKDRTCQKCGRVDCNGRKEVRLCQNPCQDCRGHSCRGRNSKRPKKPCWDASWDD
ncbi:hypothetical protein BYT27DRAFT_7095061, partial [Phlegmacium glaucopus]